MSKKHTVLRDELMIKGGGVYCFLPFDNIDKFGNAVFKIGVAIDFNSRTEQYHTYYPLGVYFVAFLKEPRTPIHLRGKKQITTKEQYLKIEKYVLEYLVDHGGENIKSTTRTRELNEKLEGKTEWVYAGEKLIHKAFVEAQKNYGGEVMLYSLKGINKKAVNKEKIIPNYEGKIIYKLEK
jgi:hypothetical protein